MVRKELRKSEFEKFEDPIPSAQFFAICVKVIDGDTINVQREDIEDFDEFFPVRFTGIDAPELGETDGDKVKKWLKQRIEGEEVMIIPTGLDKFGRLLGRVIFRGMELTEEMLGLGLVKEFEGRKAGGIPTLHELLGS